MDSKQTRLIIILSAVLLAVLAASGVILYAVPDSAPTATEEPLSEDSAEDAAPSLNSGFNIKVLQSAGYAAIDSLPVVNGTLPVKAPLTPGKANPFL